MTPTLDPCVVLLVDNLALSSLCLAVLAEADRKLGSGAYLGTAQVEDIHRNGDEDGEEGEER